MRAKKAVVFISSVFIFAMSCSLSLGATNVYATAEIPSEQKALEATDILGWDLRTEGDFYTCDIYFSEQVLYKPNGTLIDYRIIDGANYADAGEDFSYLQEYVTVNGSTIAEINGTTDMSESTFTSFPCNADPAYRLPIVVFCPTSNIMRLWFHVDYADNNDGMEIQILEGFEIVYADVRYTVAETVAFYGENGGWTCDNGYKENPITEDFSLGFSLMSNWADGGDAEEYKVCDLYFSRNILIGTSGGVIGYRIMDGKLNPQEDFSYIQEYLLFNGKSMKEINEQTDVTEYAFSSFPATADSMYEGKYLYKTPILIYSDSGNHLQIRIHDKYVETENLDGGFTITAKAGLYGLVTETDDELKEINQTKYTLSKDVVFTKAAGDVWTCSEAYQKYIEEEEVIERADIDFDAIDYEPLTVNSISSIIQYGDYVTHKGRKIKNQYFCIYFDKPISYQYIPYASVKKSMLSSLAKNPLGTGVHLTQAQVDAVYDYRIDIYLNDYVKVDGLTLREMKDREILGADSRVYISYAGSSSNVKTLTFYLSADSESWLDPEQAHTVEVLEGFRTPLFGEVQETIKFYYDPETQLWNTVDYTKETEWKDNPDVNAYEEREGCSGSIAVAWLPLTLISVLAIKLLRKEHENE